jgi:hypothetical protein
MDDEDFHERAGSADCIAQHRLDRSLEIPNPVRGADGDRYGKGLCS